MIGAGIFGMLRRNHLGIESSRREHTTLVLGIRWLGSVGPAMPRRDSREQNPPAARSASTMATYAFLSDEWVSEARKIREEHDPHEAAIAHRVKMNLVITEVPFGEGAIDAHVDSMDGSLELELGHIEPAALKVSLDYLTAKALLVDGDPQVAMQAFITGKIRVEGDMAMLMAIQAISPDGSSQQMAKRLREITE
jgi:putative sterol carrier protein